MIRAGTKIILLGGKMKEQQFFIHEDKELYYVAIHHNERIFDLFTLVEYQSSPMIHGHPFALFVCKGTFESYRYPNIFPEINVELKEPDWLRNPSALLRDFEEV